MNWQVEQGGQIRGVWATREAASDWCLAYEDVHRRRTHTLANFGWQITETNQPVTDPPPPLPGEGEGPTRMTREEARSAITDLLGGNE